MLHLQLHLQQLREYVEALELPLLQRVEYGGRKDGILYSLYMLHILQRHKNTDIRLHFLLLQLKHIYDYPVRELDELI